MATTQSGAFPFVESGYKFVERALQWGEQYGIGVLIDFHAAPGSQNGARVRSRDALQRINRPTRGVYGDACAILTRRASICICTPSLVAANELLLRIGQWSPYYFHMEVILTSTRKHSAFSQRTGHFATSTSSTAPAADPKKFMTSTLPLPRLPLS